MTRLNVGGFNRLFLALLGCCMMADSFSSKAAEQTCRIFFGTYTGKQSKGIYVARFDLATGRVSKPELAVETKNPSFLALHPNQKYLYAVSEVDNFAGQRTGGVSAFRISSDSLELLNQQPSGGAGPCHLSVDRSGSCLMTANYGSGSIASMRIESDGRLAAPASVLQHKGSSVNPARQAGPHAHFITPSPDNRFALVCDLGLDKVLLYKLDAGKGTLAPAATSGLSIEPGAGPRHLALLPKGRFVYVVNEMGSSVTVCEYASESGALNVVETISTLPAGFEGDNTCAGIQVHPSGQFVYASNRGHDSIAVFTVDGRAGRLRLVQHEPTQGKVPRFFALDPSGKWLLALNQKSSNGLVLKVDSATGRLTPTGNTIELESPVCAVFLR